MTRTRAPAFTVVVLKPEIASGAYAFSPPDLDKAAALGLSEPTAADTEPQSQAALAHSSIPGVPAVEAALLYPNGQTLPSIFVRFASAGLRVVEQRCVEISKSQARALFSHERERLGDDADAFRAFLDSFTRGLSLALVLVLELPESLSSSDDAVSRCKELVGNNNPVAARQDALSSSLPHDEWPLRALCGLAAAQSGILCSATLDCAYRERASLFPPVSAYDHQPLDRAVLVVLPSFLKALPEGRTLLLSALAAGGVLVSTVVDSYAFASPRELELLEQELQPATAESQREQFAAWLQEQTSGSDGGSASSLLLEVEALDLATKLRCVLGPASLEAAQRYFPGSVRAQLRAPLASSLTHLRAVENSATCVETGVFVSFDSQTIDSLLRRPPPQPQHFHGFATSALHSEHIERTFAIIKPGTASDEAAVTQIQSAIRAFGFTVEKQRRLRLSRAQAATFYSEHRGKAFFERLLGFMTSGELIALQLARKNAVRTWRALMGPTNALVARETHPWTLRARFGVDGTRNATHGSDAASSAQRELQFFFGGGLCAFGHSEAGAAVIASTKTLAQRALPPPYWSSLTLEKVLTQALGELLLVCEAASQQEACLWLGNWLLAYSQRQQHEHGFDGEETSVSRASFTTKNHHSKPKIVPVDPTSLLFDSTKSSLVAIAFASDVTVQQRSAVGDTIRSLAAPRFAVFNVASVLQSSALSKEDELSNAVATLVKQIRDTGKRRVVLFDMDLSSSAVIRRLSEGLGWPVNYAITIGCSPLSETPTPSVLDTRVPHVHFYLQQHQQATTEIGRRFQAFFADIFRPSLVVVHDSSKQVDFPTWRSVAQHFGLALLVFDDLVRARVADERDPSGPFTELERTRAKIPKHLLLALVSDAIQRFQLVGANNDAPRESPTQRFLLCNFPVFEVTPFEFEECVGRIFGMVHVVNKAGTTAPKSDNAWIMTLNKRGAVTELQLDDARSDRTPAQRVHDTCALSFGPVVGFCFVPAGKLLDCVKRLAREQGFAILNMSTLAVAPDPLGSLKGMLFRASGFWREKFLVCGFSTSPDAMRACIESVVVPRIALLSPEPSASDEMERLAAVLDEYPEIVQLDPAAPAYAPNRELDVSSIQAALFGKHVSFVVGDSDTLDATRLHSTLAPLGYCVLDLRKQQLQQNRELGPSDLDDVGMLVAQIRATAAPRCLVIGAPEHIAFYRSVEEAVGNTAVNKIVVLKRLERQAPPSQTAKRNVDDSDDYSDGEEELERQREQQIRATASHPHLEELLQVFDLKRHDTGTTGTSTLDTRRGNGHAVAVRLAFLDVAKVYAQLHRELSPRLIGVVGHPHSFYRRVLQTCARRNAIGALKQSARQCTPLQARPDAKASLALSLATLQHMVATTPFATYFVDGFPRSNYGAVTPSVAQQLLALEATVAPMLSIVRFGASMDVLVERKAAHVTRHQLDDAQDALEEATMDLLALFASRSRSAVLSVSCERELADAEEALGDALKQVGILR